MESDHNASHNGPIADRNGARTARPRLADLLESVKLPDETVGNGSPSAQTAQESTRSASVAVPQEAATLDAVDDLDASSRRTTSAVSYTHLTLPTIYSV